MIGAGCDLDRYQRKTRAESHAGPARTGGALRRTGANRKVSQDRAALCIRRPPPAKAPPMNPPSPLAASAMVFAGGGARRGAALPGRPRDDRLARPGDGHRVPLGDAGRQRARQPCDGPARGLARAARRAAASSWRLLIGVGLLGGFTTFSSFSLELMLLIERGQVGLAFALRRDLGARRADRALRRPHRHAARGMTGQPLPGRPPVHRRRRRRRRAARPLVQAPPAARSASPRSAAGRAPGRSGVDGKRAKPEDRLERRPGPARAPGRRDCQAQGRSARAASCPKSRPPRPRRW